MIKKLTISFFTLILAGCGAGSGKGLDNQGLPITDNSGGQPPTQNEAATLASLQKNIFGAICTNCHTGSNAPRGLRLDSEENSYAFLVQHAADEVPELMRVNPGKPDESYIIRKLEGASGIVGSRMPLGGPYLTQEQINNVRDWIANGAPRSGTGTNPTKISNVSLEKTDSQVFTSMHFSRALGTDSITAENISISYLSESHDKPVAIENFGLLVLDQSIEISVPTLTPAAEAISIVIHSPSEAPVLDIQQQSIDGNGDDNHGGEYRYEHTLK